MLKTIQLKTPLGLEAFLWLNGALVRLNELWIGEILFEERMGLIERIERKPVTWQTLARTP